MTATPSVAPPRDPLQHAAAPIPRPMAYAESILDLVGRDAARPAHPGHPRPRPGRAPAAHPRQARDAQPGRLGQGPDRAADDRGGRAGRPAASPGGTIIEPTSRATPATAWRSRRRSRAIAASSSWPTSSRPRSRRSCGPTAPRSSSARRTSPPESPESLLLGRGRGSRATSRAPSSPTSTGTWRTPRRTSGRPAPRSGTRPRAGSPTSSRASAPAARSPGAATSCKAQNPADLVVVGADPGGQRALRRHRPAVPDRGNRRGLLPRRRYDPAVVDRWVRVSDRDAFAMARRITREEGILAGESCGTAVVAALDEVAGPWPTDDGRPTP